MTVPKYEERPPLSHLTDDELRQLKRQRHRLHDETWEEAIYDVERLIDPEYRERILTLLDHSRRYLQDVVAILNERLHRK